MTVHLMHHMCLASLGRVPGIAATKGDLNMVEHTPSFPLIDATKPRRDMWYLKKHGLPFMYWNLMLKGLA